MHETVFRNKLILWHGTPESKGEVTNDIAVKTTCESINEIIITVDHIDRSHRIGKYNPKKKNLKPVIVRFTRYNVRVFSNEHKLKGKQVSISESLTKMHLMKLKEARDQYTFANVWTQVCKTIFKDDCKVQVCFN